MNASDYAREQLREAMKSKNIGVLELSRLSGKDKAQISRILNDSGKGLGINLIDELFFAMGYNMGFLLVERGDDSDEDDDPALD